MNLCAIINLSVCVSILKLCISPRPPLFFFLPTPPCMFLGLALLFCGLRHGKNTFGFLKYCIRSGLVLWFWGSVKIVRWPHNSLVVRLPHPLWARLHQLWCGLIIVNPSVRVYPLGGQSLASKSALSGHFSELSWWEAKLDKNLWNRYFGWFYHDLSYTNKNIDQSYGRKYSFVGCGCGQCNFNYTF